VGGRGGSSCPPHHPSTPLEGVGPFRRKSRKTLLPQPPWLGLGESGGSTVHRLTPPHLWRVWVRSGGRVERRSFHSHHGWGWGSQVEALSTVSPLHTSGGCGSVQEGESKDTPPKATM
jgi:hypothetical protein